MILEKILSLLTALVEFVAKTLLFLLNALGLWIPALYSIIFIIVCAILKVQFTAVLGLFFVGLALSLIFSFYLTCMRMIRKKNRRYMEKEKKRQAAIEQKEAKRIIKENKKKRKNGQAEVETPTQPQPQSEQQSQPYTQPLQYSQQTQDNGFIAYPQPYPAQPNLGAPQFSQYESPLPGAPLPQQQPQQQPLYNQYGQFIGFGQVGGQQNAQTVSSNPYDPFNSQESRFNQIEEARKEESRIQESRPLETPKVFKTRMDPDLLIYEFSDRLVFYKKTEKGLDHVHTEWKKK